MPFMLVSVFPSAIRVLCPDSVLACQVLWSWCVIFSPSGLCCHGHGRRRLSGMKRFHYPRGSQL